MSEKKYESTLIYDISYKISMGAKPLRFRFDKIDGFVRNPDKEIRRLVLFDCGFFDKLYDNIKYLMSKKNGITVSINHNFGKITIDSYNSKTVKKY